MNRPLTAQSLRGMGLWSFIYHSFIQPHGTTEHLLYARQFKGLQIQWKMRQAQSLSSEGLI